LYEIELPRRKHWQKSLKNRTIPIQKKDNAEKSMPFLLVLLVKPSVKSGQQ
jgi:hypothetical protein